MTIFPTCTTNLPGITARSMAPIWELPRQTTRCRGKVVFEVPTVPPGRSTCVQQVRSLNCL
ncbi:unnamed protein product, partial [Ectocarpus sp. 8 AP-2014]